MIVSIHQPAHLPWPGYLERIARSDVFVFLDTVQYEKNSFTNRNRIKTPQGVGWLTIPVLGKGHLNADLRALRIDESKPWRRDHLKTVAMAYRRAPNFESAFAALARWYDEPTDGFAAFCWRQLRDWVSIAGISTRLVRASTLDVTGAKSALVLALCREVGATTYLSGPLGRGYLDEEAFLRAGIALRYQAFRPPVYPQLWGGFEPGLSTLDLWMNCPVLSDFFAPRDVLEGS